MLASVPTVGTEYGTDYLHKDLSGAEEKVILELIKNPYATYDQLALETGISRRSISRAIASLSEKKYIERIGNNKTGF